ncbi:fimbrial protein [Pseudomonas sp. HY2-MNA-CIBAN-0224]|uniref:fimbrial protein n=1 Tax=Pseudomonas sp. HY2-MNA-CIBAN-0224 TaxID=3140471 RepID=UPI00333317CB
MNSVMPLARGLAMTGLILALSANLCRAEDEPIIGTDGLLDISGSLNHAPCMLEMSSAYQTVELNNVSRADLLKPGDMAEPVAFQLRFLDCRRIAGGLPNERTGRLVWSPYEPIVSVAFVAPADPDDPRLVKVQGVTGMGLRLTDTHGRDVRLGSWGQPLFLVHGRDTMTWYVQATRTPAPLTNGAFRAVVDFRLNYD